MLFLQTICKFTNDKKEIVYHPVKEKIQTQYWVRIFISGAGYEARTRYLHLGKVALYQMS